MAVDDSVRGLADGRFAAARAHAAGADRAQFTGHRGSPVVMCSSSPWLPVQRREHVVARSAAAAGIDVVFVEGALDARALLGSSSRHDWLHHLRSRPFQAQRGLRVLPQSTLFPGHLSGAAQWVDGARLTATLRRIPAIASSVVVSTRPWQWPAVAAAPAARRVFDCGDDWGSLIPQRRRVFDDLCRRIGQEADAVILASPDLLPLFADRDARVVGNGTDSELLRAPVRLVPAERRMVYVGTLSERFDAAFLGEVLRALPGWSVDLYGLCQYAGQGFAPDSELQTALATFGDRLRWHGPAQHRDLAEVLDRGRVLIVPHRISHTRGQDSMKLYDYAARGRPIVATAGALGSPDRLAEAGALEAATPSLFAAAVISAGMEDPAKAVARRAWAERNSWDSRWPAWAAAALDDLPK